MNYDEWEQTVPQVIRSRFLWKTKAYRLALFASDIGWPDVTKLSRDSRTEKLSSQLYRSLGSIGANIAEADSRSSGKDRARIHEIALGETNESIEWYLRAQHVIGDDVVRHRIQNLDEISRLLAATIHNERHQTFREESPGYNVNSDSNSQ